MTLKSYSTMTGTVFGLVALAHLIRVAAQGQFIVGGWNVPSWVSLIVVVVAGYLSYLGFRFGAATH